MPLAPLFNGMKVGCAFGLSTIDWMTHQLFRMSRQYRRVSIVPVSYTHLTLPTILRV